MNPDTTGPTCPLCKRPMSSAESAGTRLCSQCRAIVKNVLPGNDIPATVGLSPQPSVGDTTTGASQYNLEALAVDSSQQQQRRAGNGQVTSPRPMPDSLQGNRPIEPVNSPFDFTTGPLDEPPPPVTARLKGGVLETVLRESGALRSVENGSGDSSLAEELETLRRTAGLEEPAAGASANITPPESPAKESGPAAVPQLDTNQLEKPVLTEQPPSAAHPAIARESRIHETSDPWSSKADEWPVLLTDSPEPQSGKWRVVAAIALLLLVVGAIAVSYRVLVKPAKPGAEHETKAEVDKAQPSSASRAVPAAAANADSRTAAEPQASPSGAALAAKPEPSEQDNSAAKYSLQAASLPSSAAANQFAEKLIRAGIPAYVVAADIPGRGRWYRVRVGRFASQEEATRFASDARLRAKTAGIGLILVPCDYEKPQM